MHDVPLVQLKLVASVNYTVFIYDFNAHCVTCLCILFEKWKL